MKSLIPDSFLGFKPYSHFPRSKIGKTKSKGKSAAKLEPPELTSFSSIPCSLLMGKCHMTPLSVHEAISSRKFLGVGRDKIRISLWRHFSKVELKFKLDTGNESRGFSLNSGNTKNKVNNFFLILKMFISLLKIARLHFSLEMLATITTPWTDIVQQCFLTFLLLELKWKLLELRLIP